MLSDAELVDAAARTISVPKEAPADSFVLHAPLELLARAALLTKVRPRDRDAARDRIVALAAEYDDAGPPAEPAPVADPPDLAAAIAAGDLDATDAAARALAEHGDLVGVVAAVDAFVDSTAAAGHAPIYADLLPKVAPRSRAALALLRPLARELARNPAWRIEWLDVAGPPTAGVEDLLDSLLATPLLGPPGSPFIHPLVHQVDVKGVAAEVVGPHLGPGPTDPATALAARRAIARAGVLSMLQDDPGQAPYGWSHALTMPLSAGIVSPAVAATHLVAFRAGLGTLRPDPAWVPEPVAADPVDALAGPPPLAAAAAWHLDPGPRREDLVAAVVGRAAVHPDAHLAKYVLACSDGAALDPAWKHAYLAAASFLVAWWGP